MLPTNVHKFNRKIKVKPKQVLKLLNSFNNLNKNEK